MPQEGRLVLQAGHPDNEGRDFAWVRRDDEATYTRRWAADVREEFARARERRRFFRYWEPAMEGAQ